MTTTRKAVAPTASVKKDDNIVVTDSLGRSIVYRQLKLLDKTRVLRVIGEVESSQYQVIANVAAGVRKVGDEILDMPTDLAELEHAIELLGDEGLNALDAELRRRHQERKSAEEHKAQVGES